MRRSTVLIPSRRRRRARALLAVGLATCVAASVSGQVQDDTNLLLSASTQPFLMIVLDTSTSMNLGLDDKWLEAGGDDPRSRIHIAKSALYEVFGQSDDFMYAFVGLNQDNLRVRARHYLYYVAPTEANKTALAGLGKFTYPRLTTAGVPLTSNSVPNGDLVTFGKELPGLQIGTCDKPIQIGKIDDLADLGRQKLNRYAKLGVTGEDPTAVWVQVGTGAGKGLYRVTFTNPAAGSIALGASSLMVEIEVAEMPSSATCTAQSFTLTNATLEFTLERPFLIWDDDTDKVANITVPGAANNFREESGGPWATADVSNWNAFRDIDGNWYCDEQKPFSGGGWEGNYDSGPLPTDPDGLQPNLTGTNVDKVDSYCTVSSQYGSDPNDSSESKASCVNLKRQTVEGSEDFPELHTGDFIPFDWNTTNKDRFLSRLNPNHGGAVNSTDFGAAGYFSATPNANGVLTLPNPSKAPIIAAGPTPLGSAMLDSRCYYQGDQSNKCKAVSSHYPKGFMKLQQENDPNYVCRRPFMIIIGDGEDNCGDNNNQNSVTSDYKKIGNQTWALTMSKTREYTGIRSGGGDEVLVASKGDLIDALEKIRGEIIEQTRSFASAAVPSVQADVADKVYLTTFEPVASVPYWRGHVRAFLKPVPLKRVTVDGVEITKADETKALWDFAKVVRDQQVPSANTLDYTDPIDTPPVAPVPTTQATLGLGPNANQRRVLYAVEPTNDAVPRTQRLFAPPPAGTTADNDLREDLWRGLGLADSSLELGAKTMTQIEADASLKAIRNSVHEVLVKTLYKKKAFIDTTIPDDTSDQYLIGDVFHANPEIIGPPSNAFYLANPIDFPNYLDFAVKHQRRRNVLFVAANDGQLHAVEAGLFDPATDTYTQGTGRELFSYIPRAAMPTLTTMALRTKLHRWSVDGNLRVFDALVDPVHNGTPTAAQREWRTLLFGGMRRGGAMIYALDITQPDELQGETASPSGPLLAVSPADNDHLADCLAKKGNGTISTFDDFATADRWKLELGCDSELPWPAVLWEFIDDEWTAVTTTNPVTGEVTVSLVEGADGLPDDEDQNGENDLGETWSTPNVGVIKVQNGAAVEKRFVAIFGGGRDPDGRTESQDQVDAVSGDWMYVVDVETGKLLYKHNLHGSAAAEPAAVDIDQDGYIDRIYIGTTAGYMYRIDTENPPALDAMGRIIPVRTGTGWNWTPFQIFDTVSFDDPTDPTKPIRRPIFFRPSVIYVPELNEYALAFGTGRRDAMWAPQPLGGNRTYVFVDDTDELRELAFPSTLPDPGTHLPAPAARTEADIMEIDLDITTPAGIDFLVDRDPGERGWYIPLEGVDLLGNPNELVATPVSTVSGLTSFSTFLPTVTAYGGDTREGRSCDQRGRARNFLVFTDNADVVLTERFEDIGQTFVSEPFFEANQTQNEIPDDGGDPSDPSYVGADDLCADKASVADAIKARIFPSNCRYGNFRFDLKLMRSDTGLECLASIPVCIVEKNWREF